MKHSKRWVGGMIFAAAAAAMVAGPAFVSPVQGQQGPATRPSRQGGGGRGPNLGGDMRAMGQAFQKIVAQYKDPTQNDSTLTYLATFESNVALAKGVLPPTINAMPEADRPKATEQYRLDLRNLLRASLDLEDEILSGDIDKAAASVKTMQDLEKSGHAEFRTARGG